MSSRAAERWLAEKLPDLVAASVAHFPAARDRDARRRYVLSYLIDAARSEMTEAAADELCGLLEHGHAAGRELDRRRSVDVVTERPADWPAGVPGVDPTSDAEVDRALRAELRCADCGCRGRVGADGVCPGCTPPAAPAGGAS